MSAKNTVSLIHYDVYESSDDSEVEFSFRLACGNNLTRDRNIENIKAWPMLAVAVNELSSVHCTATIGMVFHKIV